MYKIQLSKGEILIDREELEELLGVTTERDPLFWTVKDIDGDEVNINLDHVIYIEELTEVKESGEK